MASFSPIWSPSQSHSGSISVPPMTPLEDPLYTLVSRPALSSTTYTMFHPWSSSTLMWPLISSPKFDMAGRPSSNFWRCSSAGLLDQISLSGFPALPGFGTDEGNQGSHHLHRINMCGTELLTQKPQVPPPP